MFCNSSVVGGAGISVPGKGLAHLACLDASEAMRGQFKSLDITVLTDGELTDLQDLALAEINSRNATPGEEVDLF